MFYSAPIAYRGDASGYFACIAELPWAVWLDSVGGGRYDILTACPIATLETRGLITDINDAQGFHRSTEDPLALLRKQLGEVVPNISGFPFCGGALGYWSYDWGYQTQFPVAAPSLQTGLPDIAIGIYDWAIVIDHHEVAAKLVSYMRDSGTAQVLPEILKKLSRTDHTQKEKLKVQGPIRANLSRAAYESAFNKIQRYISDGDCYQVNLAQRFTAAATGDALPAYLHLRKTTPAPYSAFLNMPQGQILCASPERFLRVQQGCVETKPIKGTRKRVQDQKMDLLHIQDLRSNAKDRAENLMIVDLLRNDLGKSCEVGSICVNKLFEVESFANVHHLVSTITGKLAPQESIFTLLAGCFPGGSITGAPKKRAMEIIAQLEPNRRGIYCGSIGYIGWDGNMDSNIAIRTLIYSEGEIHFSVGGGIVADSIAENEFQETLDKASGMFDLLRHFGG